MLEKIRKILAKAEGTNNEEEAKLFFMKAQELMAREGITLEEVNQGGSEDEVINQEILSGKKTTASRNLLLAVLIAKNFKVKTYLQNSKVIRFMGFSKDVEIAKMTFESISKFMEKKRSQLYRQYKKEGKETKGIRESYTTGFLRGLEEGFKENVESKALVIVTPDAVVKAFDKEVGNNCNNRSVGAKVKDHDTYTKGYMDGINFNKNRIEG